MKLTQSILFFLLIIQVSAFAKGETHYSKLDSTYKTVNIQDFDSLRTADSLKLIKNQKRIKIAKLSILSALAAGSGYGSLLYGLDANGYPMLFLGLLCIGFVVSIFKIKKRKSKTYDELKIKESEPLIKKTKKYNESWNYSLYIGILGFTITVISILFGLSLYFLFLPLFLSSLLFFIMGFKGKYDSPEQYKKKLFLGFLGLFLHWIPIIILVALLSGRGE